MNIAINVVNGRSNKVIKQEHLRHLAVKSGITGYAQISCRNDLDVDGCIGQEIYCANNICKYIYMAMEER